MLPLSWVKTEHMATTLWIRQKNTTMTTSPLKAWVMITPWWETTVRKRSLHRLSNLWTQDQFYSTMKIFISWAPRKFKLMIIKSWWTIISKRATNSIYAEKIPPHWKIIYKGEKMEINRHFWVHIFKVASGIYLRAQTKIIMVACRLWIKFHTMDKLLNLMWFLHLFSHQNKLKVDIELLTARPLIHM